MRNHLATTLVFSGSAIIAIALICGAFIIGRLLAAFPVVNNSNDEYFIWLWLLGFMLVISGVTIGVRLVNRGIAIAT
jgi:hypothetical protein